MYIKHHKASKPQQKALQSSFFLNPLMWRWETCSMYGCMYICISFSAHTAYRHGKRFAHIPDGWFTLQKETTRDSWRYICMYLANLLQEFGPVPFGTQKVSFPFRAASARKVRSIHFGNFNFHSCQTGSPEPIEVLITLQTNVVRSL